MLPDTAELHGDKLNAENQGGEPNIGSWDNAEDWISWKVLVPNAGTYKVKGMFAAANGDSALQIQIGGQKIVSAIPKTASWADFAGVELGTITIGSSGEVEVKVAPGDPKAWKPVNLRSITLAP